MEKENPGDKGPIEGSETASGARRKLKRRAENPESSSSKKYLEEPTKSACGSTVQQVTEEANYPVSKQDGASKEMENKQTVTIRDMPVEIIILIFSFLPFDDMVNVQKVCRYWESVTSDTLVWKHAPLNMRGRGSDIFASVPYLHTVIGFALEKNYMLNSLVEHVLDLRKIDCLFSSFVVLSNYYYTPSLALMQNFFKKFVNLEYFVLHHGDFISVQTLDMLSSCQMLNTLDFHYRDYFSEYFPNVCKAIGDGFPALRKLYIRNCYTSVFKNNLFYMLKKKINQLTELSLASNDPDILGLILKSSILEKLEISYKWPVTSLDFSNIVSLKSLSIYITPDEYWFDQPNVSSRLVNALQAIKFPVSLESVTIDMHKHTDMFAGIVSKVINSSPNLKVLDFKSKIVDCDINEQLEHINNLRNLHTVSFEICPALSIVGFEYITNCAELRKLKFKSNITFTDKSYECLKDCKYLSDVDLSYCILNFKKLLQTLLQMEYLKDITLCGCVKEIETGQYVEFTDDEINIMKQECWKKNCNVTVNKGWESVE